jgi:hypothetical protein
MPRKVEAGGGGTRTSFFSEQAAAASKGKGGEDESIGDRLAGMANFNPMSAKRQSRASAAFTQSLKHQMQEGASVLDDIQESIGGALDSLMGGDASPHDEHDKDSSVFAEGDDEDEGEDEDADKEEPRIRIVVHECRCGRVVVHLLTPLSDISSPTSTPNIRRISSAHLLRPISAASPQPFSASRHLLTLISASPQTAQVLKGC